MTPNVEPSFATPLRRFAACACALASLALAVPASAAGRGEETSLRKLPVRVELAADGAVVSTTARRADVPAPLRALVEGSASRARYAPASVSGQPVPSALWVTAITRLHFDADGDLTASVIDVVAGGLPSSAGNWPTPSVRGATGYGAQVLVHAVFDETGRSDPAASRVELLEVWRDDGKPIVDEQRAARGRPFVEAARSGMRRWRWDPETVDGRGVRSEFAITLTFASMRERMRSDWIPPAKRETTYRALPPDGVRTGRIVSWEPARGGKPGLTGSRPRALTADETRTAPATSAHPHFE